MKHLPFTLSTFALLTTSFSCLSADPVGKTIITRGQVMAFETESDSRKLKRRSPIYNVDTVNTQAKSKAQFRMSDGSLLAIKENTTLLISDYQYQGAEGEDNSMVLELVKGGLRSVTGAIKENNGSYQLKTPVGSIGIRGTHFEIELVDGEMFLAVWDGAIDLTVDVGTGDDTVSFGEGEDFSFGVVTEEGEVTELLEAPEVFDSGHSDENTGNSEQESEGNDDSDSAESENAESEDSDQSNEEDTENSEQSQSDSSESNESASESSNNDSSSSSTNNNQNTNQQGTQQSGAEPTSTGSDTAEQGSGFQSPQGSDLQPSSSPTLTTTDTSQENEALGENLNQETFDALSPTPPEIVAAMQGSQTFSQIVESNVDSAAGNITAFNVNMNVNFDTSYIDGELTATDDGGDWFAVYQGFIDQSSLALGITHATYGNELATGEISGFFTDDARKIFSEFELSELNNSSRNIKGNFILE